MSNAREIKELAEAYAAACELYARKRTWEGIDKSIRERNELHKAIDAMQAELDLAKSGGFIGADK